MAVFKIFEIPNRFSLTRLVRWIWHRLYMPNARKGNTSLSGVVGMFGELVLNRNGQELRKFRSFSKLGCARTMIYRRLGNRKWRVVEFGRKPDHQPIAKIKLPSKWLKKNHTKQRRSVQNLHIGRYQHKESLSKRIRKIAKWNPNKRQNQKIKKCK